ncbi:MAG: polysaccharide biosynthesis C-terminal domain-containing protein, partial [Verrucomicrobiota bacterium]
IIATACAMNAFFLLGETMLMIEHPKINLINSAIAFTAAVGFNLIFIPALGPLGAAFGMLIPYAIQGILRGIQITRIFHWRWPWRALLKPWVAALAALPCALLFRFLLRGIGFELAAAGIYLVGYFLVWKIIGLDPSDRAVLDHLRRKTETSPVARPAN